jgi:hypothetical protein
LKKIVFIIPWFGPFPFWMSYTLRSIRLNKDIDFIFFTDNERPEDAPTNFIYNKIDFTSYKKLVSEALKINFTPVSPYKLCDIKPSYGLIHAEEIRDYDFWGFCDIDVIFGNIRNFITDEVLDKYDFFTAFKSRVAGHFTLMKNDKKWRSIFKECPNWKFAFEDNTKHHCFDEKDFSNLFIGLKRWPEFIRKPLLYFRKPHSRKALIKEMYSTPELRYDWVDGSRNFPTEWYWADGKLTNDASDQEFLYLHFLKWKRDWNSMEPTFEDSSANVTDSWIISQRGFENA